MVNAVALFHRGNCMKHRTTSTAVILMALLALMAGCQAEASRTRPKSRSTTFFVQPSVAFESTQISDRHLDAWMSENDHCRDFLMYHDHCAQVVLPDEYDDGLSRRVLRSKSTQLTEEALGAYCRDLHVLWKQQWKGQCPAGEDDDEGA